MKRTIWITGAGSGIGKALTKVYAENGNTLILSGRSTDKLEALRTELNHTDCTIHTLALDVSNEDAIQETVNKVLQDIGPVDVLINNAGVSQRSLVKDTANDVGRKLMETNFFGTIHLTKALLPSMLSRNSGSIVVMSSAAGKFGFPMRSYYGASKHALHGFFDALSLELHDTGINVLLVCPGRINTDISINALTGDGSSYNKNDHRLKGGVSADKLAKVVKKAERKKKKEIYFGGQEVLLIYIKRFIPALYRYISARVKLDE